ncbi:MAG TPA: hypothetical protein VGM90_10360 [Kofleriaceae bacterium]|jgi:hypothetical protein
MSSVWVAASRVAAWAPDIARELIANAPDREPHDDARAGEILGRAFAATGAWDLARDSFLLAAEAWEADDPARALAVSGVARALPVKPFIDDAAAIAAELDIVQRLLTPAAPTPVVRRTLVELQRSLAPRRVVGTLEVAFGLSPTETALLVAAAAPLLDPGFPALSIEQWEDLVASSTLAPFATIDRLVRMGAIAQTSPLTVAPGIASWLLGRRAMEHPGGVRLYRTPPALATGDVAAARRLIVDGASVVTSDPETLAAGLIAFNRSLIALRPPARARRQAIVAASVEARLHGGIPLIDLETWESPDVAIAAELAPCVIALPQDPVLANELRGIVAP